ncbi:ATP-dependent zinc metalloprotease FtsH [Rubeoparvulum massiliense]|uniref:ATP-dependent zinc metalloprotease FtsH n=1 Tax=Rubeoparvulum massiliense TaxID=1631346 RepID=UPI000977A640|nr:ATP-dependent zinc metalloprotease FtsH [Rubeoparvulum massiliense]
MNRFFRNTGFYLLIFLVTVGIFSFFANQNVNYSEIPYNEYRVQLFDGNVSSVTLKMDDGTYYITGKLKSTVNNKDTFSTRGPFSEQPIADLQMAQEKGLVGSYTFQPQEGPSVWMTFLTSIIPFILIFVLFFFLLNQAQGGGNRVMSFGKSKAKLYSEDGKKKVTFKDVAGADEEKAELEEVVEFLKDPRKFAAVGARIPKGILLFGPPGTGKTLLARAVAGEAGVPFFSISGSDFVEMFVGVGASRVRDLFETAKKNAPCIIFIDEIDAVGRQRGAGLGGGHDEREQTLNQLLVEMDGFGENEGIIIIAATNRPDILDPALLRPGRFDRQITVDRPDVRGREAVLKVHARNKPLSDEINLSVIARRTPGFTGADLENLLNEAALLTARRNKKEITMSEVDEAIDRVIAGPEKKSRLVSEKERRLVAYHEAGHTIVGFFLDNADEVHKVTVIPRGGAGGYTVMLPKEDQFFMTKQDLLDKITGLLGGRVAEELVLGDVSTGASNDFQRATSIARGMVTKYGMSDKLGPMQLGQSNEQVFLGRDLGHDRNYSEKFAYEIDVEVKGFITQCYDRCKQILTDHRQELENLAQALLKYETLDGAQIKEIVETGTLANPPIVETNGNGATPGKSNDQVKVTIHAKEEREEVLEKEPNVIDLRAPQSPSDEGEDKPKE